MSDPLALIPGFVSPLTDKEHARIGRIAILWGQVEFFVDQFLPRVSGLSREQVQALDIFAKPIAAKVSLLKVSLKNFEDPSLCEQIGSFCELIDNTKVARNHLFHGVWGWRVNTKRKTVEPCARQQKTPSKPLKIADLSRLEKDLCRCSRLGADVFAKLLGHERDGMARFFHGEDTPGGYPEWLPQWTEQNPLDHRTLDQNAKEGQLPRPRTLSEPKLRTG